MFPSGVPLLFLQPHPAAGAPWPGNLETRSLPLLTHIFHRVPGEWRLSLPSPGEREGFGPNLSCNSSPPEALTGGKLTLRGLASSLL